VAAFLAPEAIPTDLLDADTEVLPAELAHAAKDELLLDEAVGALYRYSLVTRDQEGLRVHRLVQVVVRADLSDQEPRWAEMGLRLVWAGFPAGNQEVATWPICERLLPHALAVARHAEHMNVAAERASELLSRVGGYLWRRAQFGTAKATFERALAVSQADLGPNHPDVATIVNNLGLVLRGLGDQNGAKAQFERALAIDEAALGPNHPEVASDRRKINIVLQELDDGP
jgi:tetratricopeptide (TPR) repeat protein